MEYVTFKKGVQGTPCLSKKGGNFNPEIYKKDSLGLINKVGTNSLKLLGFQMLGLKGLLTSKRRRRRSLMEDWGPTVGTQLRELISL